MGSVYQRGKVWWIKYYHRGKAIRESCKTESKMVARSLLALREGEIAEGKIPGLVYERVKYKELRDLIITDYTINRKKSLDRVNVSLSHLDGYFTGYNVLEITTDEIDKYKIKRLDAQAAPASINRELSCLKRMFSLAVTAGKAPAVPTIKQLQERNTRKGFFEHGQFLALREALPHYLKGLVTFAYKTGWRREEILALTWSQVDQENWIVRLEPGTTKSDGGRSYSLDEELIEIFKGQWAKRKATGRLTPYVFPNKRFYRIKESSQKGDNGKINNFNKAWKAACEEAGIDKLFHDLRRTAVRNMVRAGIPERVAMQISGHKTRSVFDRYDIVSDRDLKEASAKLEQHLNFQDRHNLGTTERLHNKAPSGDGR
jgi:integrase